MGRKKKEIKPLDNKRNYRPALTPDAREKQLIALAVDLAEQQLRDGTASSQVITHYLKMGSMKEKLERERLEKENKLIDAKVETLKSVQHIEELYKNALDAMKNYRGDDVEDPDDRI